MRILVWGTDSDFGDTISPHLVEGGNILFRESEAANLLASARNETPELIVLLCGTSDATADLVESVKALSSHPDTRWTPVLVLSQPEAEASQLVSLLDAGAGPLIRYRQDNAVFDAQLRSIKRSARQLGNLRSKRLKDEKTGFYHQSFLQDQLKVFCRKKMRDGVAFCLVFVELRGSESEIRKVALNLNATVRGADLFGRWDDGLFAVLLPASQQEQARLLVQRFESIIGEGDELEARAALVASDSSTVEPEAMVESALNTLDAAWQQSVPFLWTWDGHQQAAVAH